MIASVDSPAFAALLRGSPTADSKIQVLLLLNTDSSDATDFHGFFLCSLARN